MPSRVCILRGVGEETSIVEGRFITAQAERDSRMHRADDTVVMGGETFLPATGVRSSKRGPTTTAALSRRTE